MEDILYGTLAHDEVRDDERLFHLVASASFIEITSHLYTQTLLEFFAGDGEIVEWLKQNWVREELQHGAALKRYVQTARPDFDWEAAYAGFLAEYSQICTVELTGRHQGARDGGALLSSRLARLPSTAVLSAHTASRC